MKVCRTIAELRETLAGINTGFVPTMGAFHSGHIALMEHAKKLAGHCTVSSFVNPTQFGATEDLSKYPRRTEQDLSQAEAAGVDVFFLPSAEEIYPQRRLSIDPGALGGVMEGEARPGHFAGVCLVVLKLFLITQPKLAVFGRKDLQQCAVIKAMVEDFNIPLQLVFQETIRESSGLAMSSRNDYFTPDERQKASRFPHVLAAVCELIREGQPPEKAIKQGIEMLENEGFSVDYLKMVNEDNLAETNEPGEGIRLVSAIRHAGVRLLDNMPISQGLLLS